MNGRCGGASIICVARNSLKRVRSLGEFFSAEADVNQPGGLFLSADSPASRGSGSFDESAESYRIELFVALRPFLEVAYE